MNIIRVRALAALLSLVVATLLLPSPGLAQEAWPRRAIRIIVPYGAGAAPDVMARVAGDELGSRLGQPAVIENRVGAGGLIGTEAAIQSKPDGYTLFLGSLDTQAILAHLYPSRGIDPVRDLAPISLLARIHNVIIANPALPASNVRELVALARQQPGKIAFGSPGVGTNLHLIGELLKQKAGIDIVHVPYKTLGPAFTDATLGQLQLIVIGLPPAMPFLRDNRLKALGSTGPTRSPFLPNVATLAEQGVEGLEVTGWFGLLAPRGTPREVLDRLGRELVQIGQGDNYRKRIQGVMAEPVTGTAGEFAALIERENRRWGEVIRTAGIKGE